MTNDKKTIQDKIDNLDKLVSWFQGDDFQLEEAAATLKEAAKLATDIEKDLKTIGNEIVDVKKTFQSDLDAAA